MDRRKLIILVLGSVSILLIGRSFAENIEADLPCRNGRESCHAEVSRKNTEIIFEVSCICKKSTDEYEALLYLHPLKCPHVPNAEGDKLVDQAILRIEKCNVEQEEFPPDLLKVLRRSKKLEIIVQDSKQFRIPATYENDHLEPVIEANILNSHVTGIGRGWFNMAKSLSLKVIDSSLGVLEAGVFGNYNSETKVDIEIENSNITVIKQNAFSLPTNGNLVFRGGNISQIEQYAFEGGKSVTLEASRLGNIQIKAFNIFGMKSFTLDSCLIANVEQMAVFQDSTKHMLEIRKMPDVELVTIASNKFAVMDGKAFAGLCSEKTLKFYDNFIMNLTSEIKMKDSNCLSKNKKIEYHGNNGFDCQTQKNLCDYFKNKDDMSCILSRTSWCLCNGSDEEEPEKYSMEKNNDNSPCKKPLIDHLKHNCKDITEDIFSHCNTIKIPDTGNRGRSLYYSSNNVAVNPNMLAGILGMIITGGAMLITQCHAQILSY